MKCYYLLNHNLSYAYNNNGFHFAKQLLAVSVRVATTTQIIPVHVNEIKINNETTTDFLLCSRLWCKYFNGMLPAIFCLCLKRVGRVGLVNECYRDVIKKATMFSITKMFVQVFPRAWYAMCMFTRVTLRKKCPYSELFWSAFSRIRTEYGEIRSISLYSVQMQEMADQNNSVYGHFSRSVRSVIIPPMAKSVNCLTKVDQLTTFVASKEIYFSMQSNLWLVLHVSPVTALENHTVSLIYLFLLSIYDLVSELGCKQQTW